MARRTARRPVCPQAGGARRVNEEGSVHIRGLRARCIIGVRDWERRRRQSVVLDIAFETDLRRAARTDRLADAVDYKRLKDQVLLHVAASGYRTLEALAGSVADLVLADARVSGATVTVDKPGALSGAESVAVRVRRWRA